ncbi:MerR family transcriptional regulator [bacterium]|nr:MerR family transcriptional regulator [bacterium]
MVDKTGVNQPKYRISIIAEMLEIHPQTVRAYEKLGLIQPARSKGNTRLFSEKDRMIIEKIQTLTRDLGVNLAGVEIIMRMSQQIEGINKEAQDVINKFVLLLEKNKIFQKDDLANILKECRWLKLDDKAVN